MTDSVKQRYDVYLNTPHTGLVKVAEAVLLESAGQLTAMGFRYSEAYREHPQAFALDPVHLPLSSEEYTLPCAGGMPGILDDYLPDDWGRKVLAKLAFYRDQRQLNAHSAIDTLAQLSTSRIGAMQWTLPGEVPDYGLGCDLKYIEAAETAAQSVDTPENMSAHLDEMSLLYLANAGTGVGGARPKALLHDSQTPYLAKFNRLTQDQYNNAKVELACLHMAKAAGIPVALGHVRAGVNQRDVLMLNRFDIVNHEKDLARRHMITINALLKNPDTQRDRGGVFRYDDIADVVRRFSVDIEADLTQLLRMMLFNRAINNTDDHERNFSLINDGSGYTLSPAYDIVPSLARGVYPVAGYQYQAVPPRPSDVESQGKIFGLPKTIVKTIADQVIEAVEQWPRWAQACEVSDEDIKKIQTVISV